MCCALTTLLAFVGIAVLVVVEAVAVSFLIPRDPCVGGQPVRRSRLRSTLGRPLPINALQSHVP
jgi:hypothetical protein